MNEREKDLLEKDCEIEVLKSRDQELHDIISPGVLFVLWHYYTPVLHHNEFYSFESQEMNFLNFKFYSL